MLHVLEGLDMDELDTGQELVALAALVASATRSFWGLPKHGEKMVLQWTHTHTQRQLWLSVYIWYIIQAHVHIRAWINVFWSKTNDFPFAWMMWLTTIGPGACFPPWSSSREYDFQRNKWLGWWSSSWFSFSLGMATPLTWLVLRNTWTLPSLSRTCSTGRALAGPLVNKTHRFGHPTATAKSPCSWLARFHPRSITSRGLEPLWAIGTLCGYAPVKTGC